MHESNEQLAWIKGQKIAHSLIQAMQLQHHDQRLKPIQMLAWSMQADIGIDESDEIDMYEPDEYQNWRHYIVNEYKGYDLNAYG